MRILVWHVHGGWMDGFVRGSHEYVLPVDAERGPRGLGIAGRDWPSAVETTAEELAESADRLDAVVLQRPEEIELVHSLTGRRPGADLPAVYVEHNTPRGQVPDTPHPLADQSSIPIVHVTQFNALMWDNGSAPVHVVEHGVRDPGPLYTGELARLGVVVNEPVRRGRVVGLDLLPLFAQEAPLDVYGMGGDRLAAATGLDGARLAWGGDLPSATLHPQLAARRAYLHPFRWTSLGLALIEAMHLGMPVLAIGSTEAWRAVPAGAGSVSSSPAELAAAARHLISYPEQARESGLIAREAALARYGLGRFLADWEEVLADVARVPEGEIA
ncbi:glycosyl transferase [Sinomonas cellulolyticus]|uniref:Glycosyltransferase family 1 protein n=1 Tax=Sinomonas cellulolyticus TaxID=2801916 RepID=A0ABS1K4I1_9MICC|nr:MULTISPECIES: glycosyltransferase family 1 protein [Sinomonas]MBL0705807.1 glycosyltransferase family 1 protein [Sinomonas cellulolyticus]GHG42103.1 glycosyl transferase [Sinomonas sp. KCTC 49339]